MSGLTSQHHFLYKVPDNWILEAQRLKRIENNLRDDHIFKSGHQWIGKVAEWSFYKTFADMEPVTSHFKPTKKDFVSKRTRLRYELKNKWAENSFQEYYHADLNFRQYKKGEDKTDIYVFCSFSKNDPFLRICGWCGYDEVEDKKSELLKEGELWLGKYPVKSDKFSIPYAHLNSMHLLISEFGEQVNRG